MDNVMDNSASNTAEQADTPKNTYVATINQFRTKYTEFQTFFKKEGKRFFITTTIFTLALVGLAYIANLKLGSAWYNVLTIAAVISFASALWQAKLIVDMDWKGEAVPAWRRKLVLMLIAGTSVGVMSVTTISILSPNSFISQDISEWDIVASIGDIFGQNEGIVPNTKELNFVESEYIFNERSAQEEGAPILVRREKKLPVKGNSAITVNDLKGDKVFKEINYRFFLRNFMDREGFNPKRYWDRSQWSIGYGSRTTANDNRTLTKLQAYELAQKELEVCRKKFKADFPWCSYNQELVGADLYYNSGLSSITGLGKIREPGEALPIFKRYAKNPYSVTFDELYSAFVNDKDCATCRKGKKCGHQERKRRNSLQFLCSRSQEDLEPFLNEYKKLMQITQPLASN